MPPESSQKRLSASDHSHRSGPPGAFSPDIASWENDVYMYFDHTPNEGVRGSFDSTKPIEYENAALDAIRERHDFKNGGILTWVAPSLEMIDSAEHDLG
jgi:hypothetical protein